jgi:hypothetical protein
LREAVEYNESKEIHTLETKKIKIEWRTNKKRSRSLVIIKRYCIEELKENGKKKLNNECETEKRSKQLRKIL